MGGQFQKRDLRGTLRVRSLRDAAQAEPKHDHRVYFGCESCEEHAPENSVNCREDIGVMPDGTWLCDGCYSDCDKSAYGMSASDVDDFEFPRFEDLPRPAAYPLPSTISEPAQAAPVPVAWQAREKARGRCGAPYADLVRELQQASDEYDGGHGPLHAIAANAIEHLTTLLRAQPSQGAGNGEAVTSTNNVSTP